MTSQIHFVSRSPASMALLQGYATAFDRVSDDCRLLSPKFNPLQRCVHDTTSFTEDPRYLESPFMIGFLQMMLLSLLSMHNGIMVPDVKHVELSETGLTLLWDTGIRDHLSYGVHDDRNQKFIKSAISRLYSYKVSGKPITLETFQLFDEYLRIYESNLTSCMKQIDQLVDPRKFAVLFKEDLSSDILFLFFSCMPIDTMNKFFLYISPFFPEDLFITTKSGNRVNVATLFESTSSDTQFLIEKVQIYSDLFHHSGLAEIKEITRSESCKFMLSLSKTPDVMQSTLKEMRLIKDSQLTVRIQLYQLTRRVLARLLKRP